MNEKFIVTVFAQEPNPNDDDDDDGDKDRYRSPARLFCTCCISEVGRYFWSEKNRPQTRHYYSTKRNIIVVGGVSIEWKIEMKLWTGDSLWPMPQGLHLLRIAIVDSCILSTSGGDGGHSFGPTNREIQIRPINFYQFII